MMRLLASETDDPLAQRLVRDLIVELEDTRDQVGPFAAGADAEVEMTDLRGGRNIGAGALLTVGLGHSGFASKKAKAK